MGGYRFIVYQEGKALIGRASSTGIVWKVRSLGRNLKREKEGAGRGCRRGLQDDHQDQYSRLKGRESWHAGEGRVVGPWGYMLNEGETCGERRYDGI